MKPIKSKQPIVVRKRKASPQPLTTEMFTPEKLQAIAARCERALETHNKELIMEFQEWE